MTNSRCIDYSRMVGSSIDIRILRMFDPFTARIIMYLDTMKGGKFLQNAHVLVHMCIFGLEVRGCLRILIAMEHR